MGGFLVFIGSMIAFISVIAFLVGIGRLIFISENKQLSLKIILFSVIAFVIGFGTCAANFTLGNMH
ncbi:hypothetical protein SAMN05444397_10218 [Flavobacterium aquidurense]|uniref:Uncharacterized protein n=1 Tax=Flavobacterium frigidimaris TaxID=262320 RepID=A0ABX4BKU5_FLAFR|nr:hypothetical protein [Flavobacterium frigidimaris]OXA75833.1 hypothetical protein B0A65_20735 [Flavobacterium frigidimaris]SDY70358.1 hypothetical protein SAMN05444397_10218 [Flavobacterium aquidurense]